jgi:hypothetical protein
MGLLSQDNAQGHCRQSDATALQPLTQQVARAQQPRLERGGQTAELFGCLGVAQTLQVAEHHGVAAVFRQALQLFIQDGGERVVT